ncbi:uncharacterized protein LOC115565564 [Drosophila navojoa]|uniref:uncharacterized protein LOC115565564 n=1 Tax=Drosophila navojoa TaxID=7232 RepID=UPI0011BE3B26|nr:uncharacterized protein LOC115565564 [Drosophila navojoa]
MEMNRLFRSGHFIVNKSEYLKFTPAERKYRGTDLRIAKLELEYIMPSQQLHLIDVTHGIKGHPRKLYDTLLNLNWLAVREEHYSLENDPYHILRQPHLDLSNINELEVRKMSEHYEHLLSLHRIDRPMSAFVDVNIIEKYFKAVTKHRKE